MVVGTGADSRIGKLIKSARTAKGWSQNDLAKRLSERKIRAYGSTIAKIEAGERPVKAAELTVLADLFGVSTDKLLGRDQNANADRAQAALVVADTATRAAGAAIEHAEKIGHRVLELGESPEKLPNHQALLDGCVEGYDRLVAAYETLAKVGQIARGIVHDELKSFGLE